MMTRRIRLRLRDELHQRVRGFLNRQFAGMLQFNQPEDARALVRRWKEARSKLRADADAPLPVLSGET